MTNPAIRKVKGGLIFSVKIVPGSNRTSVCGFLDGMVKIKISAPPEKGKANRSLVKFLAKKVGVKRKDVHIISGQTNPVKSLEISGISAETLASKLGLDK
jgi:uncharacterized protein (TIGR00251 family)